MLFLLVILGAAFINYNLFEKYTAEQKGEKDTLDWRLYCKARVLEGTGKITDLADESKVSCWHDIPLLIENSSLFNYVNEIPKGSLAKMECATNERWNPLKQDIKNGRLRYFTYGVIPFNYGYLPQTWEDPTKISEFSDTDTMGDNDPVDVVELSDTPLSCGQVSPVKVLGVVGLIDEGETDWKVLTIDANHKSAVLINSLNDVDKVLGEGTLDSVRNWYRMYKTTDGKPENAFTHGGAFLDATTALGVVDECHMHWKNLVLNKTESTLDKTSRIVSKLALQDGDEETLEMILTEVNKLSSS